MTTQAEFLRALSGDIADTFVDAGVFGAGTYTPKGRALIDNVRMAVDEDPLETSTGTRVTALEDRVRITLLRPDVPERPRSGDTIVCDGSTYVVHKLESHDAGAWVVLCPA